MASVCRRIPVGRLISVYGVKGWLKVLSYTEPPENLFRYQPWLLCTETDTTTLLDTETLSLEEWRSHNKGFVAKIAGVGDREQAKCLCGLDIAVDHTHFPPLSANQYYWYQLQGLSVVTQFNDDEVQLGFVRELMPTGANDILVVEADAVSVDQRERLIPYVVDRHVKRVDLEKGIIYVEWDPNF